MKNKNVPTDKLGKLLCLLGENFGGLLTKEQILNIVGIE